ncbi:distal membrane-arm assembly complex protein 2 [Manacus candei]|uniref:distal membrane-arm assembly complex protein 2 n=1 Tax=Manacus candei TaxID=415023 RepID=UPI002227C018|nr:distal membrane-arm assembly complex protein 2 [Manacus candei]
MAALRALGGSRWVPSPKLPLGGARGVSGGLLTHLGRWFYDLEEAAGWAQRLRRRRLQWINRSRGSLGDIFGVDVVAAEFTLSCGGGVRFLGQEGWIRPESPWKEELLRLRDLPVVGLDLSGTPLTYEGLDNLVSLSQLSHLELSGCPHVCDWTLGRLHVFGATLRHLGLARCPQVTERGLATLHHLRSLRSLDVSGLGVPSAGLVRILLEEMLPGCRIVGMEEPGTPPGPPGQ